MSWQIFFLPAIRVMLAMQKSAAGSPGPRAKKVKKAPKPKRERKVPRVVLQRQLNAARAFHFVTDLPTTELGQTFADETAARVALLDATLFEAHKAFAEPIQQTDRDPLLHALDLGLAKPGIVSAKAPGGVEVLTCTGTESEPAKPPRAVKKKGCLQAITSAAKLDEKRALAAEERRTRPKKPRAPRVPRAPKDPADVQPPRERGGPEGLEELDDSNFQPNQPDEATDQPDQWDQSKTKNPDSPTGPTGPISDPENAEPDVEDEKRKKPRKPKEPSAKRRKTEPTEEVVVVSREALVSDHEMYESPGRWIQQLRVLGDTETPLGEAMAAALTRGADTGAVELVVGPPGTGKSVELLARARRAAETGGRILVTAPTNLAVADLYRRYLSGDAAVPPMLVMRAERVPMKLTEDETKGRVDPEDLCDSRVVFATAATVTLACMRRHTFDRVLVDEAGMLPEAACWCLVGPATERLVLCGDPAQLEGMVSDDGRALQFGRSLFRRLLDIGEIAPHHLDVQRRMHPDIAALTIDRFYGGRVRTEYSYTHDPDACGVRVLRVLDCRPDQVGTSFQNQEEAATAVELAHKLQGTFATVVILCPYAAQAALCRDSAPEHVEVATVDSFQGREADAVVLSMVRTGREGFWSADERLCVALTRARHHLSILAGEGWTGQDLGTK